MISDMQNVQNQMFMIIQDMQRKVNEIYLDWKAAGFGSSQNTASQAIYAESEKSNIQMINA
nr:5651_t:CDS:2 [Entrophospora candida]